MKKKNLCEFTVTFLLVIVANPDGKIWYSIWCHVTLKQKLKEQKATQALRPPQNIRLCLEVEKYQAYKMMITVTMFNTMSFG